MQLPHTPSPPKKNGSFQSRIYLCLIVDGNHQHQEIGRSSLLPALSLWFCAINKVTNGGNNEKVETQANEKNMNMINK